MMFKICTPQM
ncbi:hypothetical protein, partial [Plasmodium yoelii yoelii]